MEVFSQEMHIIKHFELKNSFIGLIQNVFNDIDTEPKQNIEGL